MPHLGPMSAMVRVKVSSPRINCLLRGVRARSRNFLVMREFTWKLSPYGARKFNVMGCHAR